VQELLDDKLCEDAIVSKECQEVEAMVEKLNALQSKLKCARQRASKLIVACIGGGVCAFVWRIT
jgi:hypothetical protein